MYNCTFIHISFFKIKTNTICKKVQVGFMFPTVNTLHSTGVLGWSLWWTARKDTINWCMWTGMPRGTRETRSPMSPAVFTSKDPKINCSQIKLPNFGSPSGDISSKIGRHFSNKVGLNLKSEKNAFYKKGAPYLIFFNENVF